MKLQVKVAYPYDKMYKTDKNTVIMHSPRISGKSYALAQMVYIYSNKYFNHDMVVSIAPQKVVDRIKTYVSTVAKSYAD